MPLRNEAERWGGGSITLHWLTFLLILGNAGIGLFMGDLPRNLTKLQVFALHKSLGITVLALTALRLLWRLASKAPLALPDAPRWQMRIAALTHVALYLLLLTVPLSGWYYNSLSGAPLQWFTLFNLPALAATDLAAKGAAKDVHELLFYVLSGVVFVHAAAALGHHYVWRDNTFRRMLPSRRRAMEKSL
ncbi:cytochrome b [soil metagenome]